MIKKTKKYYFSVEGETEQWYLKWLQNTINSIPERKYNIKLDLKIEKDPLSRAKGITILEKTEIIHVFDKESEASIHQKQFYETLDRMKEAIKRAKDIMDKNEENGHKLENYKGYKFYKENPSLSIWKIIEKMLYECGLLSNEEL